MFHIKNTNLTFIHPPKCGGTSIAEELKAKNLIEQFAVGAHATLKDIGDVGKEYLIIVRNPYNRFFSYYHFMIEWARKRIRGELPLKGQTKEFFQKSIDKLLEIKFEGWVNTLKDMKFPFWLEEHSIPMDAFRCQTNWYLNYTNKPVHIHKIEEGTIWPFLRERTGIKGLQNRHEKKSTFRTVNGYTDEQAELVYQYFKQDFEILGYDKGDYKRA